MGINVLALPSSPKQQSNDDVGGSKTIDVNDTNHDNYSGREERRRRGRGGGGGQR